MRIAIVSQYQNYPGGGVEVVTEQIISILKESGHQVTFFSEDAYSSLDRFKASLFSSELTLAWKSRNKIQSFDAVICNGEYGFGIDHPHAINLFHGSYAGYKEALSSFLGPRSSLKLSIKAWIQKKSAKGKKVIAVSEHLKVILERYGIAVDTVIECAIDTNHFYPRQCSKKEKYLFVGSFDFFGKGLDILEKIAQKKINIDCVTSRKSGSLGWIPQLPHKEMPDIYSQYKILLFPSRFEGFGLAPLEAMACGVPVVMSAVGFGQKLKSIIPEFVAVSFDPDEYIEKANRIEDNYSHYSELARDYVERHHSKEQFNNKWRQLFEVRT